MVMTRLNDTITKCGVAAISLLGLFLMSTSETRSQWVQTALSTSTNFLLVDDSTLYASTSGTLEIYRSTDDGLTWAGLNNGLYLSYPATMTKNDLYLFAGAYGRIFRSSDGGDHWILTGLGLPSTRINSLMAVDTLVYAATGGGGVYVSTDNGTHWTSSSADLSNVWVWALALHSGFLFAAAENGGVYRSSDLGEHWTATNEGITDPNYTTLAAYCFTVTPGNVFVGTRAGVYRSSDNGSVWLHAGVGLDPERIDALATDSTSVFANVNREVFLLRGNEEHWINKSEGLNNAGAGGPVAVKGNSLFVPTGQGVFTRPLSELTAISPATNQIPSEFSLEQNYPNPFNPSTTIRYALPQRSHVTLTVFNTLGQQMAMLVNGEVEPGYHEVQFNASGLSSGVYFYRIHAGDFVQSKKLLLLK